VTVSGVDVRNLELQRTTVPWLQRRRSVSTTLKLCAFGRRGRQPTDHRHPRLNPESRTTHGQLHNSRHLEVSKHVPPVNDNYLHNTLVIFLCQKESGRTLHSRSNSVDSRAGSVNSSIMDENSITFSIA